MKKIALLVLFVVVQWAMIRFLPWAWSFLSAAVFGWFLAHEKRPFWLGFTTGVLAWYFPLVHFISGTGWNLASRTAQIFQLSAGSAWILFLIPLLFGGLISAVGVQIGHYARFSFQQN